VVRIEISALRERPGRRRLGNSNSSAASATARAPAAQPVVGTRLSTTSKVVSPHRE